MTKAERQQRKEEQKQSQARIAVARAGASTALRTNQCPQCGRTVRRNLSLTGWVQCSQFGAPQFRADASQPACSWQGFTE